MTSYLSDAEFTATWEAQVSREQFEELRAFADAWYERGELPKHKSKQISFTIINQQLFYEATMEANATLFMARGAKPAGDVKMAMEGGYGNHLFVEKLRHNTLKKALAERDAKETLGKMEEAGEDMGNVMGGEVFEFDPSMLEVAEGEVDAD